MPHVRDARHHDEYAELEVLTDVEFYTILQNIDINDGKIVNVDYENLTPLAEKYGGFNELSEVFAKSIEPTHSVSSDNVHTLFNGAHGCVESVDDDTSSSHQPEPETAQQSINRVCEEYVNGEIETVLELEDELEAPVTKQLEPEGLLV